MIIALVILGVAAAIITGISIRNAPVGYEADDGFHYQNALHRKKRSELDPINGIYPPFPTH